MSIAEVLVAQGLIGTDDLAEARRLQREKRWSLGESLVQLGKLASQDLESVIASAPVSPTTLESTGISPGNLLNLLIKIVHTAGVETPTEMADMIKLPLRIVLELIEQAEARKLMTVVGASITADIGSERRFTLTSIGSDWALASLRRDEYVGPAPVPLSDFCAQIGRQRIETERIDQAAIDAAMEGLVVGEELAAKLGPAINSSRAILLYGPPGNGKTSIAESIGSLFTGIVWVPYCFEVDGQIVKVFDPGIHEPVEGGSDRAAASSLAVHRELFDPRWQACRRPFVTVGGELNLDMLELAYKSDAKFYEAPLHIKAVGGVCLIDDFGRQLVTPKALLNRWIIPLEGGRDRLKLHSGKSFSVPFDELVVFATNLAPHELMDAAFLRRIPYKVEVPAPTEEAYRAIFKEAAEAAGMTATDEIVDEVIEEVSHRNSFPLGGYQPRFIIDQVRAACRFAGIPPQITPQFLRMALSNLHTRGTPGFGVKGRKQAVDSAPPS